MIGGFSAFTCFRLLLRLHCGFPSSRCFCCYCLLSFVGLGRAGAGSGAKGGAWKDGWMDGWMGGWTDMKMEKWGGMGLQ